MATESFNLFIIHRPYQLLNATEYAQFAGLARCHLIVIEDESLSKDYFTEIAEPGIFDSIEVVPLRDWYQHADLSERRPRNFSESLLEKVQLGNDLLKRRIIDRLAKRVGNVDELILGSYRRSYAGYMRHLANRISHKKLVLIDVGTDTLEICRQRREEYAEKTTIEPRSFRDRYVDWDTRGVDSLTFFSSYDLTVSPADRYLKNEFRHMRSALGQRESNGQIWFLGQPIADQQYLSWQAYERLMAAVIQKYGSDNMTYVAHPYESQRQLDIIRSNGATIERFPTPVEITLSRAVSIPSLVTGFFSSAIAGCAAIFGDSLRYEAIRIPESMLEKQQENLCDIYDSFASHRPDPISVVTVTVD